MKYLFFVTVLAFFALFHSATGFQGLRASEDDSGQKIALIFGVTGQDGAYLTEFLLEKNYVVHGVKRRSSCKNTERIDRLHINYFEQVPNENRRFFLHDGDLTDSLNVMALIQKIRPDEIYNLAAQSHVKVSFELPVYTSEVNALGTLYILEAIRLLKLENKTKFYQASTSELFGEVIETPQVETTPFYPRSPYGVAKMYGYWTTVNYREAYGIFGCNGILFNHESPHRGEHFVTRKITLAACRYYYGLQDILYLGNLDAKRDWGYAKDYVEAMWLMLQQEKPDDFVIATGEAHSVREFVEVTYRELGINIAWQGEGNEEYGVDPATGKVIIKVDPDFYRPAEVEFLLGNSAKAEKILKWKPKTTFEDLVKMMVAADLEKVKDEARMGSVTRKKDGPRSESPL